MLSPSLSAGGSSTTLMRQIDGGIGFIGYYLEGQQEPHTGALQFAGHLVQDSETAGGTERRQTFLGPASPALSYIIHLCKPPSADQCRAAEAERAGEPPGRGEKNQLLLWKRQPEKNWGCVPGRGGRGRSVSAWKQPCGLCTCTTLCTSSHRKREDRKCRANSKKSSTIQIRLFQ